MNCPSLRASKWVDLEVASESGERTDATDIAALYGQHAADLRSFLTGVLRDRDMAEEVLQTVFHRATDRGQSVHSDFRAWLFRVAYNEAMQVRRKQSRERTALSKAVWLRPAATAEQSESTAVRDETVAAVRRAIDGLPEAQQQVVRMRIYEDVTFAVIAERLGIPLGTVLTRMRLATQRLQKVLKTED